MPLLTAFSHPCEHAEGKRGIKNETDRGEPAYLFDYKKKRGRDVHESVGVKEQPGEERGGAREETALTGCHL